MEVKGDPDDFMLEFKGLPDGNIKTAVQAIPNHIFGSGQLELNSPHVVVGWQNNKISYVKVVSVQISNYKHKHNDSEKIQEEIE